MEKDVIDKEFSKALDEQSIKNCNQIASQIQEEHKFLFCDGFYYEYENGVFVPIKEDAIKKIIKNKLGDKFTQNKANEIVHSLRVDIALNKSKELNETGLLNLKNGMFDLQTFTLFPHSPDYKSTIQLPVNYNPDAKCDKWFKTLQEIFKDEPEKVDVLQEFFGLCFTKDTKYDKALFIIGEGANGKSTLLYILQQILGERNYSSVPLELFNNQHYTANFYNRLVNISIETNAKSSVYDSLMKSVTSGDVMTADFKYQNSFQFKPFCKLIFALNNMPRVDDKTDAFYRRLIIVRFNRQFDEKEQNKNLKYELEVELDGIFVWMLNGLERLRQRKYFEPFGAIKQEVEEYRKENNNVLTFVDEECQIAPELIITKQTLYDAYAQWCKVNGYRGLSKNRVSREILKHFKDKITQGRDGAGDTRIWFGVGINRQNI